jgi:hypothetical protein
MRIVAALAVVLVAMALYSPAGSADNGLIVTMEVEPATLSAGDTLTVWVSAENPGPVPIEFGIGSSSCQLGAVVRLEDGDHPASAPRLCLKDLRPWSLAPGGRRIESWAWAGAIAVGDTIRQLLSGTYELRGAAGPYLSAPIEVEVKE